MIDSVEAKIGDGNADFSEGPNLLYHAAPLNYLPYILIDNALFSKSVLSERGITPRSSAVKRDNILGLGNYIHLAPHFWTPLLADRCRRGFPHAVLVFEGKSVLALPGMALLPQNTKAWRAKPLFAPVTDAEGQSSLFHQYALGRRRGLEVLVPYGLSLAALKEIIFFQSNFLDLTDRFIRSRALPVTAPLTLVASLSFDVEEPLGKSITAFLESCINGQLPQPPSLPFD